jgi:hypothetical protein
MLAIGGTGNVLLRASLPLPTSDARKCAAVQQSFFRPTRIRLAQKKQSDLFTITHLPRSRLVRSSRMPAWRSTIRCSVLFDFVLYAGLVAAKRRACLVILNGI